MDSEKDIDRIQYGYDRAGNRIWRHNLVAASLSEEFDEIYYYDGVHRLKEMQRGTLNGSHTALTSKSFAQCWTLDSTGNWTGFREDDNGDNTWDLIQERTANGVNEITGLTNTTGPTWSSPAYNRAGNMTTIPTPQTSGLDWNTLSTDEWSDLTTDEWAGLDASLTRSATYDAWNRLVKITDNDMVLSDYTYDGAKRRIVQRSYNSGTLAETRHYYYTQPTQWQVLEERLGTSPDAADAERQFAWGLRYIDDLIVRDRDTNADSTLDERLYACQDGNWNTTAIVDDSGAVQERYAYSAYGVPVFLTAAFATTPGSASDWETLYCGYRWETATEVFHVRNRIYIAQIGTWGQRDPLRCVQPSLLYLYSINNPLSQVDPLGLLSYACAACAAWAGASYGPGAAVCTYTFYNDRSSWSDCITNYLQSMGWLQHALPAGACVACFGPYLPKLKSPAGGCALGSLFPMFHTLATDAYNNTFDKCRTSVELAIEAVAGCAAGYIAGAYITGGMLIFVDGLRMVPGGRPLAQKLYNCPGFRRDSAGRIALGLLTAAMFANEIAKCICGGCKKN